MKFKYIRSIELDGSWKRVNKNTYHSLHSMCSRIGSFPPSLARYFIEYYSLPNQRVLDPFSGKGTVPLEACLAGRIGIGNDVSPEAFTVTHSLVKPVPFYRIASYIREVKNYGFYDEALSYKTNDDDVGVFYNENTLGQILLLKEILNYDYTDVGIFIKGLMCGILHGSSSISLSLPCSHSYSMSPKYVRKYAKKNKMEKPKRDVLCCLLEKARIVLSDGYPSVKGFAYSYDASKILLKKGVDLIITSPPYYDKQTYAWDNWLRLWFLGYDYKNIREKLYQTGSVETYFKNSEKYIQYMYDILNNNSACFIVIGDAIINDKYIKSAEKLAYICESVGFNVKKIIVDNIPNNKKYITHTPSNKGIKIEKILELHKGKVKKNNFINWNKLNNNVKKDIQFKITPVKYKIIENRKLKDVINYKDILYSFLKLNYDIAKLEIKNVDIKYLKKELNKTIIEKRLKNYIELSSYNNSIYFERKLKLPKIDMQMN